MKFAVVMARIGQLFIHYELVPPDNDFPYNHPAEPVAGEDPRPPAARRRADRTDDGEANVTLSPLDDHPVHQAALPIRQVTTSDRNFYDRYYFDCPRHQRADAAASASAVPQPRRHRRVRAGPAWPHAPGRQGVARARHRPDGHQRRAVPAEVLEGLRLAASAARAERARPRVRLDLEGAIPAQAEPRHFIRSQERVIFDSFRLAQTGQWSGYVRSGSDEFDGHAGPMARLARPVLGRAPGRRERGAGHSGQEPWPVLLDVRADAVRRILDPHDRAGGRGREPGCWRKLSARGRSRPPLRTEQLGLAPVPARVRARKPGRDPRATLSYPRPPGDRPDRDLRSSARAAGVAPRRHRLRAGTGLEARG